MYVIDTIYMIINSVFISREHILAQRQFENGVSQGGILSSTIFNIYTLDIPQPPAPHQLNVSADSITITYVVRRYKTAPMSEISKLS